MDNSHYFDSDQHRIFQEQQQPSDADTDTEALPELTEEMKHLLAELQKQEVDVDPHTLQRVLEYAHKA
ncbi:MAG: hypothetical protein LBF67_06390 [Prevotellaceae bacterium]|jgi:hypothetical protein|nr:hypothetical protein [Prevotellaceae bacterium]